jgi:hypothetical protein
MRRISSGCGQQWPRSVLASATPKPKEGSVNLYYEETNDQVGLPCGLMDHRGEEWYVLNVESPSEPGKSGKVLASKAGEIPTRTFYPQVFGCYIADEPRATDAEVNGGGPA